MRMSGDDQNMREELLTAMNGQPEEAVDKISPQIDTAPYRKRVEPIVRGTAKGKAVLDWVEYKPDVVYMDTDRDGGPSHRRQPGALKAFGSPAGIDRVHQTVNGNGHATVTQRPIATAITPRPMAVRSPTDRTLFAFAGLSLLLGYAWLLAGVDKLLLGNFPSQLPQILAGTLQGSKIPGFFAGFLRAVVLPNGALFGLIAEYSEILAGLGLISAGLAILFAQPLERQVAPPVAQWISRTRRLAVALGVLAAIGTVLLGSTYYLLDGAPSQWFMPSVAFNGALDPGLQLALGSLVLLAIAALVRGQRQSHQTRFMTVPIRRIRRDEGDGSQ
jgi:hypothetical protein